MKVRFWGTRGSLPVATSADQVRAKVVNAVLGARDLSLRTRLDVERYVDELPFPVCGGFGGNTSCVQLEVSSGEHIIVDMGSGALPLAGHFLTQAQSVPQTYHVFMSHMHWDHIMGFPFFTPVYIPGNKIIIHSCHAEVEVAFRRQHTAPSFPVEFEQLAADIEFDILQPGQDYTIAGMTVRAIKQRHSGDSYGWRFTDGGKSVVYTTDSEHDVRDMEERQAFVDFFRGADIVIFDAMYSLADAITIKADWGHSSNIVGVELCQLAEVKCFCLFHHEPVYDDAQIMRIWDETRFFEELTRRGRPKLEVLSAWDGLEVAL